MKLKVIGSGSKGNAYILENKEEALLIECGVKIDKIKQALNFNISKVYGCIVTHEHADHSLSINELMKLGINVYASEDTFRKVAYNIKSTRQKVIKVNTTYQIGNFQILPFDAQHDVPTFGFIIYHPECGRVLFLTDSFYCKYTFPGLNNIIVEANYSKKIIDSKFGIGSDKEFLRNRILKSHFSLENCKELLKANDISSVNNIVLIHLSDTNSDEELFKREVTELTNKNVYVASNGMEIKFDKTPF